MEPSTAPHPAQAAELVAVFDWKALVRAVLVADDAVTALVGQNIEPMLGTQPLPGIVVRLAEPREQSEGAGGGRSFDGPGGRKDRLEVQCWASTPDAATEIASAVCNALDDYEGTPTTTSGLFRFYVDSQFEEAVADVETSAQGQSIAYRVVIGVVGTEG